MDGIGGSNVESFFFFSRIHKRRLVETMALLIHDASEVRLLESYRRRQLLTSKSRVDNC